MLARNVVLALVGAWFAVSSWILSLTGNTLYFWSALVLGVLTLAGAVWTLTDRKVVPWRHYLMALFGLWLALTPWTLGFAHRTATLVVTLVLGVVMLALGVYEATRNETATGRGTTRHAA
jgi:hypothetical protein